MATQAHDRIQGLKTLSPLQAIEMWLSEHCGHGERASLVAAIQRDRRIALDDDEIAYVIQDAIHHGIDAAAVLDRLLNAGDGYQSYNMQRLPPR